MAHDDRKLERVADFTYVFDLPFFRKRFKKDSKAMALLFELIEKIDGMGYDVGVSFAFRAHYFDTIKRTNLSLIEVRRFKGTWRVLSYLNSSAQRIVLIDAFQSHKHKRIFEKLKEDKSRIDQAIFLLDSLEDGG